MAAQPTLSNFELMVMLAIIRSGDDAYGVSIPGNPPAASTQVEIVGAR